MNPRLAPPRRAPLAAVLAAVLALAVGTGCAYYSFSGATIPEGLQTVAVPLAENRAVGAPPDLDRTLTDALVLRFADRTRLRLVADEAEADAVVRAVIERYAIAPVAVTGSDVASLNRLTLAVSVVFESRGEGEDLLRQTFTASADFAPASGLAGETEAALRAAEQIAGDAFTAATSDW